LERWERLTEGFTDLLDVTIIGLVLSTKETPHLLQDRHKKQQIPIRRTCSTAIWTWNDLLIGKTSINKHCIRRRGHIHPPNLPRCHLSESTLSSASLLLACIGSADTSTTTYSITVACAFSLAFSRRTLYGTIFLEPHPYSTYH
jgi:hypothetical protein